MWILVPDLAYSSGVTLGNYTPSSWMFSFNCTKTYPVLKYFTFDLALRMKWNAVNVWFVAVFWTQLNGSLFTKLADIVWAAILIFIMKAYSNIVITCTFPEYIVRIVTYLYFSRIYSTYSFSVLFLIFSENFYTSIPNQKWLHKLPFISALVSLFLFF